MRLALTCNEGVHLRKKRGRSGC